MDYTIALSGGSGSVLSRRMVSGANGLNYQLYGDSARTRVWGDGASNTQVLQAGWPIGFLFPSQDYSVYGRIPPNQQVAPGIYIDTILVTVTY